jgi:hypothetical protein
MKFHISIMKHLVNQEILKVQKPLSIMDLNCQYVVWQDIKLLARYVIDHVMRTKSRPNHSFGHLILSFNE